MTNLSADLKTEIKQLILSTLKIADMDMKDIPDNAHLFGKESVFNLDSVDALEITVALQRHFGVHIDDKNLGRFIVDSVDSIAEFIEKERQILSVGEKK
jgi:acyl carrier protein